MSRANAQPSGTPTRITTATTTVLKTGAGTLIRLIIGTTAAGAITVNDGTGAKLVLGASFPVGVYELNMALSGKIEIVTAGASDVTAVWS